jgi:hypothetical protein
MRARLALLALAALAAQPAQALDAWTGTVEGSMIEHGHRDNQDPDPEDRLVVDDDQVYRIRFSFGFRVTENGDIVGSGQGEYLEATWHIEGTNEGEGFSCDPVLVVPQTFDVEVVGQANGRSLEVEFRLKNVMEHNDELYCGANFTAYEVDSFEIVGSMNTADARMVTLDQANPSLAPILLHETLQNGDRTAEVDHEWIFDIRHDCGGSDYGDPSSSAYINQYDAGDALDLPISHGQKGGNSCGPTSMAMLLGAFKRGAGSSEFPDLQDLYDATVRGGNFTWANGLGTAYSMGYFGAVQGFGIDEINAWLASGVPVLASTTFSTTAWGNRGGGHVILITGRTAAGDYVVSDPAGDYYSSSTNHYGDDKCGDNVVYPKAGVEANAQGRAMLAIPNFPGADPLVLVAVGEAPGGGRGAFRFWLEDGYGFRVGFPDGADPVVHRPWSWAGLDPVLPSDPAAPEVTLSPDTWPYAALTLLDEPLLLRVQSTGGPADFQVQLRAIENGRLRFDRLETGTLGAGETRTIPIPEPGAPPAACVALAALYTAARRTASASRGQDRRGDGRLRRGRRHHERGDEIPAGVAGVADRHAQLVAAVRASL